MTRQPIGAQYSDSLANQEATYAWCGCEERCMFVKLLCDDGPGREEATRQECLGDQENDESLCFTELHLPADNLNSQNETGDKTTQETP